MIKIEKLTKVYDRNGEEATALKDIDLEVHNGEILCVIGPSGCGKTSLLRIIAGLDKPTNGRATIEGKEIENAGADRCMIFQESTLFPWRTAQKNIEFSLEIKGLDPQKRKELSDQLIELVGLKGFEDAYPRQLSSGMKQRISLARALASDPKVFLMDEPFGSLDAQTRNIMQKELLEIWRKNEKTILFVTHSVDEAVYLGDRVAILTARPGTLKKIIEVNLPRPRDRVGNEFTAIRKQILQELEVEVERASKQSRRTE